MDSSQWVWISSLLWVPSNKQVFSLSQWFYFCVENSKVMSLKVPSDLYYWKCVSERTCQNLAPVENNSGLRPVSTDFVQSMPAPGSGSGAIGQMKKMRFPGTPPPEATTLATTPAPQTPPLTTPDPLSSVDILLTPERDFKPGILPKNLLTCPS